MMATESSTTILRRMLDERGVEYESVSDTCTYAGETQLTEYEPGIIGLQMRNLTPEKAIAATLGQAERTCQLKRASWDDGTCTWGCICSACDAHLEHETGIGYNFCPNCGAKVVDE